MKHLMLDAYLVENNIISASYANEFLNRIILKLGLKAVMPPENIPYYYCRHPEDGGVSSYCLLDGGHITVHTFPFYYDCFMDLVYSDFDGEKARSIIEEELKCQRSDVWCYDRDTERCTIKYDPQSAFGPHILADAVLDEPLGIEDCYRILDSLPEMVDMHPIMRPRVITNKIHNYDIISGITIIAESHVAIHSNIRTGKVYFDLYSCKFCSPEKLREAVVYVLGENCNRQLISRGEKQAGIHSEGFSLSDNGWQKNI